MGLELSLELLVVEMLIQSLIKQELLLISTVVGNFVVLLVKLTSSLRLEWLF